MCKAAMLCKGIACRALGLRVPLAIMPEVCMSIHVEWVHYLQHGEFLSKLRVLLVAIRLTSAVKVRDACMYVPGIESVLGEIFDGQKPR